MNIQTAVKYLQIEHPYWNLSGEIPFGENIQELRVRSPYTFVGPEGPVPEAIETIARQFVQTVMETLDQAAFRQWFLVGTERRPKINEAVKYIPPRRTLRPRYRWPIISRLRRKLSPKSMRFHKPYVLYTPSYTMIEPQGACWQVNPAWKRAKSELLFWAAGEVPRIPGAINVHWQVNRDPAISLDVNLGCLIGRLQFNPISSTEVCWWEARRR